MKKEIEVKVGDYSFVFYGDPKILEFIVETLELMSMKNKDYSRNSDDNFATFRLYRLAGIRPEQGIVARMIDKIARIGNLINADDIAVKDESIEDTLRDLIAYSAILAAYLKDEYGGEDED